MELLYHKVMDFLDDTTWLPDTFKIAGYVSLMSFISRREFSLSYSLRTYYPNTYVLVIGESGAGKGVILDDFVKRFVIKFGSNNSIMPSITTPEKMLQLLSKNPIRIWINDELSTLITRKKYMSDIVDILNLVYNSHLPEITISRVKKDFVISNPTLSVAFGTQPNTMNRLISYSNITSGLIPRFLIFYGEKQQPKRVSKPDYSEIYDIVNHYYTTTNTMDNVINVEFSDDKLKWFLNLVNKVKSMGDDETILYFARINDHIAKLVLLLSTDIILYCHYDNDNCIYNHDNMSNMSYNVYNVRTVRLGEYINIHVSDIPMTYKTVTDTTTHASLLRKNEQILHDTSLTDFKSINIPSSIITTLTEYIINIYVNSIQEMIDKRTTYDQTIINRHIRAIKRLIKKLNITENDNGELIIKRRDILRQLSTTLKKLQPYEQTLKELGIIKEIRRDGKKWLWVIDKNEFERYGGMI